MNLEVLVALYYIVLILVQPLLLKLRIKLMKLIVIVEQSNALQLKTTKWSFNPKAPSAFQPKTAQQSFNLFNFLITSSRNQHQTKIMLGIFLTGNNVDRILMRTDGGIYIDPACFHRWTCFVGMTATFVKRAFTAQ